MRNDVVNKQNFTDSLLENNSNLSNHQCCQVVQVTQSSERNHINTDATDNQPNNHGVDTITNETANKQITSYKRNSKATIHNANDDSNLIKRQLTNSSVIKKRSFCYR